MIQMITRIGCSSGARCARSRPAGRSIAQRFHHVDVEALTHRQSFALLKHAERRACEPPSDAVNRPGLVVEIYEIRLYGPNLQIWERTCHIFLIRGTKALVIGVPGVVRPIVGSGESRPVVRA